MYELKKKNGKVYTSKFVGTGSSSYEKRIYRAAVSQKLRNTATGHQKQNSGEASSAIMLQTFCKTQVNEGTQSHTEQHGVCIILHIRKLKMK